MSLSNRKEMLWPSPEQNQNLLVPRSFQLQLISAQSGFIVRKKKQTLNHCFSPSAWRCAHLSANHSRAFMMSAAARCVLSDLRSVGGKTLRVSSGRTDPRPALCGCRSSLPAPCTKMLFLLMDAAHSCFWQSSFLSDRSGSVREHLWGTWWNRDTAS